MDEDEKDEAYFARGIGIALSGGVWIASAMNLLRLMHSPGGIELAHVAVVTGFFGGMICYTQLCIAEGRARERRAWLKRRRRPPEQ